MSYLTDPRKSVAQDEGYAMNDTLEKTPGVYVRANEHPTTHELDMLWSGARGIHLKDDRSPILAFAFGFIVGTLLTAAIAFFFFIKPEIKTGQNLLTAPVAEQAEISTPEAGTAAGQAAATLAKPVSQSATTAPVTSAPATTPVAAAPTAGSRYKVQSGDTLERIAKKFYGSGTPEMVDKLIRANNMKNPNALQLDQELVIPPKAY
jgi:LysM repeat protein